MDFRSDNERTERSKSTVTRAGKQTCKIQTIFLCHKVCHDYKEARTRRRCTYPAPIQW